MPKKSDYDPSILEMMRVERIIESRRKEFMLEIKKEHIDARIVSFSHSSENYKIRECNRPIPFLLKEYIETVTIMDDKPYIELEWGDRVVPFEKLTRGKTYQIYKIKK